MIPTVTPALNVYVCFYKTNKQSLLLTYSSITIQLCILSLFCHFQWEKLRANQYMLSILNASNKHIFIYF